MLFWFPKPQHFLLRFCMRYLNLIEPEDAFWKKYCSLINGFNSFQDSWSSLPKQPFLTLKGDSQMRESILGIYGKMIVF
jgi:hypothetical protein